MRETVRLGRVAGVGVGANWSLLVVVLLIAWSLGARHLPLLHPGLAPAAYWLAAIVATALFFAALLAHELAHALAARREGVRVDGITLWLLGGVARLRPQALGPGAELRIAAAGPLVSLGAAAAFGGLAGLATGAGAHALVIEMLAWLWRLNVAVACFNLVPAFPLDGGRILRAALSRRRGKEAATHAAALAGRAFGVLLVAGGGLMLGLLGRLDGIWLALLGWFIGEAAKAEEAGVALRTALAGLSVRDVMVPNPRSSPAWLTLDLLIEEWAGEHRVSTFPLVHLDGSAAGVLTLDAVRRVPPQKRATTRADSVASPIGDVPTGAPDEPFVALLERMAGNPRGRALVLQDGRIVGLVAPSDIDRALALAAVQRV